MKQTDSTRNERQSRRRERERQWLKDNGFTSWESLHTLLMRGDAIVQKTIIMLPDLGKSKRSKRDGDGSSKH